MFCFIETTGLRRRSTPLTKNTRRRTRRRRGEEAKPQDERKEVEEYFPLEKRYHDP